MAQFFLPDLGEGLQEAEIVEWCVEKGQKVDADQVVLLVETAKAIVEIPAPVDGQIVNLSVGVGETVDVGACLFEYCTLETGETSEQKTIDTQKEFSSTHQRESVSVVGQLANAEQNAALNHYEGISLSEQSSAEPERFHKSENRRKSVKRLSAPPSIKAFAESLGLADRLAEYQYAELTESALLEMYVAGLDSNKHQASPSNDQMIKLKGARKVMAQSMTKSHQHIPSVTLFDDADISHWAKGEDITLRVIKAMISACKKVPLLNAWFDEDSLSIQQFEDIHLGVAVNAADGLFVPVIRQVQALDQKKIRQILDRQIKQVLDRSIKAQKLLGATISLSNFGTLSGKYATPIIVPPQVAIVGVGKIEQRPVVRHDRIEIGRVMPLSLSFDHRAASGADAASFMQAMIDSLTH